MFGKKREDPQIKELKKENIRFKSRKRIGQTICFLYR